MTGRSDRTLNRLSVAASIGLMLMVGVTAGQIFWPRVAAAIGIKRSVPPPAPPPYVAGQQIDVPAAWYGSSPKTLVLFARASCAACEKAHPFFKSLVADISGRAAVVMAHPSTSEYEDKSYATSLGIAESNVHVATANLKVRATPTLVLVNQTGEILAAWEGAGAPDRQAEIKSTIEKLAPSVGTVTVSVRF